MSYPPSSMRTRPWTRLRLLNRLGQVAAWTQVGVGIGVGFASMAVPAYSAVGTALVLGPALLVLTVWMFMAGFAGSRIGLPAPSSVALLFCGTVLVAAGLTVLIVSPPPPFDAAATAIALMASAVAFALLASNAPDRESRSCWIVVAFAHTAFAIVAGIFTALEPVIVLLAAVFVALSVITAAALLLTRSQRRASW